MDRKKISAILKKQLKDTIKNKTVLIQFIMLPFLVVIMDHAIKMEGLPEHFFVPLIATMYIGMAPLTSMAAIVAEEKEKNTLRVLLMANVKPAEYLIGIGSYIVAACMLGAGVFALTGEYRGRELLEFLCIMLMGILISMLIGAAIGVWSRNEMAATSITVPVMMVFSFLPMIATFNDTVRKISQLTWAGQINLLMNELGRESLKVETGWVLLLNGAIVLFLFWTAYKRCGLE
ncbi:MAG: ABC transporter permease [Lachnospiraceae bacterium]|nr:ABC transporter permease [Lachnospiraceae bacterium]